MDYDFTLTEGEKSHPLWMRLKSHFIDKLEVCRAKNDDPNLTEAQTAALRGQIATLKTLISLGDSRPLTD
jgi:hypothetical protein